MKKIIVFTTSFIFSLCFLINTVHAENLSQFMIEKKINIDKKTGFISQSEIKELKDFVPKRRTIKLSSLEKINLNSLGLSEKTYSIVKSEESLDSIISVHDSNGSEIKRISVGRFASKIISSPISDKIYVLCSGYFGSVWEIDTSRNLVTKKFSTNFNPTDLAIDGSGKYLYVTSGKLQKFSISSNIVIELSLASDINYITSINPSSDNKMIFSCFDKNKNEIFYSVDNETNEILPSTSKTSYLENSKVAVKTKYDGEPLNSDIALIYSSGNDFISLFSLSRANLIGIIPLDSKIDQVLISQKDNKIYVLHRDINQISVIDISPNTTTKYSVIAKIIDDRLKDKTNLLILDGNNIIVKSDFSQEGYIDSENILRFTVPIAEVPFNKEKEIFAISKIAGKRYYLSNNQIFLEDLEDNSTQISMKVRMSEFGNTIGGLAISSDGKKLYMSDYTKNTVMIIDTETNKIISEIPVGLEPSDILLGNSDKLLHVISKGDKTITTINLDTKKIEKTNRIILDNNMVNTLNIYDKSFEQVIRITLSSERSSDINMLKLEI